MKRHSIFMAALGGLFFLGSCGDDGDNAGGGTTTPTPTDSEVVAEYLNIDLDNLDDYETLNLPAYYNTPQVQGLDQTAQANLVSDEGATLGRVIFYDKQMSINNTIACASCHDQSLGFIDADKLSTGFEGGQTGAHSMRIANARYYGGQSMFWDKRAASIEDQSTKPIQDGVEMGFDEAHGGFDAVIDKMEGIPYYPILFKKAFGDETITEARVQEALGEFMRSIVSVDSKFDEGYAQVYTPGGNGNITADFPNYTAQENLGKTLFLNPPPQEGAGCAGCHVPPTFSLNADSRSNGLEAGETTIFKSPSLKNVGITGPYMHDGELATLADVVEHYNSGIQDGPALDQRLKTPQGNPLPLNLSEEEKAAIVAFLQTLDDPVVIADARFSDPFK